MATELKIILLDLGEATAIGGGASWGYSQIWPETLHGFAVVLTAVAGAAAVFFTNRFLRKKFPE